MPELELTSRERLVLEAVIRSFVETAAPAASRTIARRFRLGVSPATIRNTMSDLEEKGFLAQPHASAGRMPTDKAYRYFVDSMMRIARPSPEEAQRLASTLVVAPAGGTELLSRAVRSLSIVSRELGLGLAPRVEEGILEKIELIGVTSERILLVMAIRSGPVRTIFVEGSRAATDDALAAVAGFLTERLAGLTLREIRQTYRDRLAHSPAEHVDLLNIFLEQGETLFATPRGADDVVLGPASGLAQQPEFADTERMRTLLELTEEKDVLAEALRRHRADGIMVSIGGEHTIPPLVDFSLVTTEYEMGDVRGTIGVIGPTRMPYERVVALVEYTARLLSSLTDH
jgi:heat-inducible transcriptional repressor